MRYVIALALVGLFAAAIDGQEKPAADPRFGPFHDDQLAARWAGRASVAEPVSAAVPQSGAAELDPKAVREALRDAAEAQAKLAKAGERLREAGAVEQAETILKSGKVAEAAILSARSALNDYKHRVRGRIARLEREMIENRSQLELSRAILEEMEKDAEREE